MSQTSRAFVLPASKRLNGGAGSARRKSANRAGRPTADELERRKGLVMEVATALFVERGYAGTSLVDIAQLSGVATRTLYHHFGDKEAIFREVIYARDAGHRVERPHLRSGDTLFTALRRISDYAMEVTSNPQSVGLMRLMIAESNRFPDFMRSVVATIYSRFLGSIKVVFEELEAAGLIPRGDHTRSAELFADISQGSHPIMIYTNWDAKPPTAGDLDERVELFIRGRFDPAVVKVAKTKKARIGKASR